MTYTKEAKRKFWGQRQAARQRGIAWDMTLEEWWAIWSASGQWGQRGRGAGCYVMARKGDVGPYAVGNVRIITHAENVAEAGANLRAAGAERVPGWQKGRPRGVVSAEHRAKLSEAASRRRHSPETRARMSASIKAALAAKRKTP